jgi:very-short-patch-repair endonuclease
LDGPHHFKAVSNWKRSVSENQDCDIQKMKYAIEKGYRIIRILQEDVYKSDNAWLDTHLKPHIEKGETITYICPGNNTIYDSHKTRYDSC